MIPAVSVCVYFLWTSLWLQQHSIGDVKSSVTLATSYQDNFKKSRTLLNQLLNLIYHRYDMHNVSHSRFFSIAMNIPQQGWDILKYKLASKIVQKEGASFIMIFGGSGVTAGYDNYINQSYPMVFQSKMNDIFEALRIKLVVRNIGQQHISCRLANYCFESMGALTKSAPADFIGWENSFSCGSAKDVFEHIARIAYRNKAVVHYSASGSFSTLNCKPPQVT